MLLVHSILRLPDLCTFYGQPCLVRNFRKLFQNSSFRIYTYSNPSLSSLSSGLLLSDSDIVEVIFVLGLESEE